MNFLQRMFGSKRKVNNIDSKTRNDNGADTGCTKCGGLSYKKENYREADNMGTKIQDWGHYQGMLLSVMRTQGENPGVAAYAFPDRGTAKQALRAISCIKTASDTGNLISLLTIDYGVVLGDDWTAILHGKGLTKEVHEEAVRVFTKYGGQERANRIPQAVLSVDTSAGQGTVSFSRREDLSMSGGIGTKMIYRATSKAAAIEFLKTQTIIQPFFYVEIETPSGWVGKDKDGAYEFREVADVRQHSHTTRKDNDELLEKTIRRFSRNCRAAAQAHSPRTLNANSVATRTKAAIHNREGR